MNAPWQWLMALLLTAVVAACRGGEPAPSGPVVPPAVTSQPAASQPVTLQPMPAASAAQNASSAEAACAIATPCAGESAIPGPTAPDSAALDSAEAEAIDALLATVYDGAPFRGAVLVAHRGAVILRRGYGQADSAAGIANTPQTRFRLGSLTKPITALAILKLQAAGRLDGTQPVCAYLAACPPGWAEITLHHLLSHTSGIPDFTRFADFPSTTGQATTPLETIARFADRPLDFAPGARWEYSNSNYIVLGVVIEQVMGQPYAAALQELLFAPLGMDDSGYDTMESGLAVGYLPDGSEAAFLHMSIPFAAGGLYAGVEDLYTLDRALMGEDLLPRDLRDQMWTAHASIPGPGPAQGYGYGWVVSEGPQGKVVGHNGSIEGFSAGLRHYLGPDLLIVALSNEERRDPNRVLDGIAAIMLP
ncbi:MAG: beta-lactamase family protein [Caldilineaceae bacterium]|nr:beta-lactamase family protein [Caldilineaceae bacterium]